jgi:hypothetical protein
MTSSMVLFSTHPTFFTGTGVVERRSNAGLSLQPSSGGKEDDASRRVVVFVAKDRAFRDEAEKPAAPPNRAAAAVERSSSFIMVDLYYDMPSEMDDRLPKLWEQMAARAACLFGFRRVTLSFWPSHSQR